MNDGAIVCVVERVGNLPGDGDRLLERQPTVDAGDRFRAVDQCPVFRCRQQEPRLCRQNHSKKCSFLGFFSRGRA